MIELNSCFTRNQFRRFTAAILFTLCTVGNDHACNSAHRILSGFHSLLIHMHYISFKLISPRIRQQHWANRKWRKLPTEKWTSERNRQFWNEMRVLIKGNSVQISVEMPPVHYFAAFPSARANLQFWCAAPVKPFWRRFKSKAIWRHDSCSILTDVSEESDAAISGYVCLSTLQTAMARFSETSVTVYRLDLRNI